MLRSRAVFASLALTISFAVLEACVGDSPAATTSTPAALLEASVERGDDGSDRKIEGDGSIVAATDASIRTPSFCESANARICTDFDDPPGGGAAGWLDLFPSTEFVGIGKALRLTSPLGAPERGSVVVSELDGSQEGATYASSRRSHQDAAPGWSSGVPLRVIRVKVFIASYTQGSRVAFMSWDDGAAAGALVADCGADGGAESCSVFVTRGTETASIIPVTITPKVWTDVSVTIPPVTYGDSGNANAGPAVTVETATLGGPAPQGKTVFFNEQAPAPHSVRIDLGLLLTNAGKPSWIVYYDDFAAKF